MDGLIANAACKTVGAQIPSGGRRLGCLPHHTTRHVLAPQHTTRHVPAPH
jgi:hypothetical protein